MSGSTLYEMILRADMYGSKPTLKIGRLETFNTCFGSFLTIFSIMLMLACFSFFFSQLFDTTNPKLVHSVRNIFNPPRFHMNTKNFGFAFGLQNPVTYDQFIDESVYRVEVYQKSAKRVMKGNTSEFEWTVTPLEISTCDISKFPDGFYDIFVTKPLMNMYCLKNNSFFIDGTFLNEQYSFLYIQLFECKNTTQSSHCKSKEYIDSLLKGTFFQFAHTDISIDPTNYTSPDQKYGGDTYTTISNQYFKEMHHFVKQVTIKTDRGWLMSDVAENIYLQDDFIKEMIDFREADNFLSYTLKLSTVLEKFERSYPKIQNVAAESGGVIKAISALCVILSYSYNKCKLYECITNDLFSLSENETKSSFAKQENNNITTSQNDGDNRFSQYNNFVKLDDKSVANKKNTMYRTTTVAFGKTKRILKLSFLQSFLYFFSQCCFKKTRTIKILDAASDEIDSKMDILNILKRLQEVERMKMILFNEDQLKLLEIPHKYKFSIEKKEKIDKSPEDYHAIHAKIKNSIQNYPKNDSFLRVVENDLSKI
jgi:hypothetical protein